MGGFGGFLILMGAGSFVLNMLDREFILLMWVDNWGPTVGNVIRVGMIVGGIALCVLGAASDDDE